MVRQGGGGYLRYAYLDSRTMWSEGPKFHVQDNISLSKNQSVSINLQLDLG